MPVPSSADRYDVIIVGARCAGAATALLLARSGLRVLLVDRAEPGIDTLSTHALMRGAVLQLTKWGLLESLVAAGTPAITSSSFDYGTHAVAVEIQGTAGVSALYAPRRTVLDPLLVDAAVTAGAHVAFGINVTGVHRDLAGSVCGVTGRDRRRRAFHAHAPLVVGADGVRSTIAEAVHAPVTCRGRAGGAVWYGYVNGLQNLGYRWFYRPGATAGLIPTNDGATCVFAAMPAHRFRAPGGTGGGRDRRRALLDAFVAAAPNAADEVRAAVPTGPVRGWPGLAGFSRRAYGPGWALVGDAGYFKDPVGAHGISQALRDAELLSDAIVAGHGGAEPVQGALAGYEGLRDGLSAGVFAAADGIASFDWDTGKVERLLRELSASMSPEVELLSRPWAIRSAGAGQGGHRQGGDPLLHGLDVEMGAE